MKKTLIAIALAAGAMFGARADYMAESKNGYTWIYEQEDEESFIVGIAETPTGTLTFPAELGGKPVKNLVGHDWGAFGKYEWTESEWYYDEGGYWWNDWDIADDWLSGVTKIVIPEGVTNIYSLSFAVTSWNDGDGMRTTGWSGLKDVSLPESLVSFVPEEAFGSTPFLRSKKFPDFVLSASGKKLWGVKAYDGEWDYSVCKDVVVPASVTYIADYALGCFSVWGKWDNYDGYGIISTFSEGNVRIIFAGAKPKASDMAFVHEETYWDDEIDDVVTLHRTNWSAVYYHEGAEGWKWGEKWCGVATCALAKVPEGYTTSSNLKFGHVYGSEMNDEYCTDRYIWEENNIGLYGDEYALIPVTGSGTIKPVILGDVPSGYLDTPQVWSDQKMFDTFTPKGVATSKWKSDEDDPDMWYYETSKSDYEWPKDIWPKKKVVSDRRWIVIHAKEKKVWSGVWSFRVGLEGTSEISDPMIVVPSEECEENGLQKLSLDDFFRGISISGYENFELWDDSQSCYDGVFSNANRPRMQTFELENWRAATDGKKMEFKVAVPSAGTLVVSAREDDDSPAMKDVFSVKGSNIVSDKVTEKSHYWDSPDFYGDTINFWKTSNATHIRRIEVSAATTLTFTNTDGGDDCEFNRMYFFPKNGKSVAVAVGYIMHEEMNGEYVYWGRDYVQGYVTGCGVYKSGETATLRAVSGSGEQFDHWEVRFGNLELTDDQKKSATLKFKVTDAMCGAMKDEAQIFISAVWKPKYKITALPSVVGAGTVTGSGRYFSGKTVTLTATAAKGYSFVKWSDGDTNPTRTVKVVAADVERILYACFYKPPVYKIKFDKNGGSGSMKTLSATYDKTVTLTANAFKRTNYTFQGWATSADGEAVYADKAKVKNLTDENGKTVKLYAAWKRNSYTVKFNANDGESDIVQQTVNCGEKTKLTKNPFVRDGFSFAGWATKKDGKVGYKNKASVTDLAKQDKSVTLYAIWKPAAWAVGTFNGSGNYRVDAWGEYESYDFIHTATVDSYGKLSGSVTVDVNPGVQDKASFTAAASKMRYEPEVYLEFSREWDPEKEWNACCTYEGPAYFYDVSIKLHGVKKTRRIWICNMEEGEFSDMGERVEGVSCTVFDYFYDTNPPESFDGNAFLDLWKSKAYDGPLPKFSASSIEKKVTTKGKDVCTFTLKQNGGATVKIKRANGNSDSASFTMNVFPQDGGKWFLVSGYWIFPKGAISFVEFKMTPNSKGVVTEKNIKVIDIEVEIDD